ncbi:DUF4062 domain-containing protein [Candidatus Uabimicrobium sp. HlEnr_7]|uniref:DUF4062 domain-containing protein n=1 Tax=Candidatus Uabimicrobium helgolandensis TaxID=3095367 RepID=UPI003558CB04
MQPWRTLKVFVSSTFKDLELERDHLAKVFTKIQRAIFSRKLQLIPYDLRWRDRHEKDIVRWCLEMVEECDYFIGILGYRYGWRPPQAADGKTNSQNISITEMEIRKALEIIPRDRRFFCFGDLEQYTHEQMSSESQQDMDSLQKLKQYLEDSGEKVFTYKDSQGVLQKLQQELQNIINRDFPPGKVVKPGLLDRKSALQEIVQEKNKGFVGRVYYLAKLREFCQSDADKNYLAIEAVAGTGKSALLANFICSWQQESQVPIIAHYMSMAGDSRSINGIAQSLIEQLASLKLLETVPQTTEEMIYQLRSTLVSFKKPLVIAIDGLDEMEIDDLSWLANNLPTNIRVVITTRAVGAWEKLKQYPQLSHIELPTLENEEILTIIDNYLEQYNISLDVTEKEILLKRATGNPLFLKVALDEMSAGGTAIAQLAENVNGLFHQILKRLQRTYGENAIENYLGLIAAGRGGIAEIELEQIILEEHKRSISDDFMIRIHKSLDNFIVKREGLLNFFHPEFERSVKMFLGKSGMRWAHSHFAVYLQQQKYKYDRTISELPYQLQWAEKQSELLNTLSDLHFLEAKCSRGMLSGLLEDFERALHNQTVPIDENLNVSHPGSGKTNKETLRLIARALNLDLQFIRRHPEQLFQCLWNRCYWHDSPITAKHHVKDAFKQGELPWHRNNDKCIYHLAEHWRRIKESDRNFAWIKSNRPLLPGLNSPLLKVLYGHTRKVNDVVFNQQGGQVISAGEDRQVYLWSTATGETIFHSGQHGNKVNCVASCSDGDTFASGANDNKIYLWSAARREIIASCEGHELAVTTVDFHPHSQQFASGSYDGKICLWDSKGNLQKTLLPKNGYVWKVLYSPDGKYLASAHATGNICVWNLETQNLDFTLRGHKNNLYALVFTKSGQQLMSAGEDRKIKIWSIKTQLCLTTIDAHNELISGLAIHPSGNFLYSVSWDRMICTWELPFAKCISKIKGHETGIHSIAINSQGTNLVTAGAEGTIRIWSTQPGSVYAMRGHEGMISNLDFTTSGQEISTGGADKRICIWSTKTGNSIQVKHGLYRTLESPPGNPRLHVKQQSDELLIKARHVKDTLYFPAKMKQFKISPHDNIIAGYFGDYIYMLEIITK